MSVTVRGWEVTTNNVGGSPSHYALVNCVGWFPLTLPGAYNGGSIDINVDGGLYSSGVFPGSILAYVGITVVTADDQPPHSLALSDSGYTWRPGRHFKTWNAAASAWSAEGPGATLVNIVANGNTRDYTLIDGGGGSPNFPGEGCYYDIHTQPYGWDPNLDNTQNEHPAGTYTLAPGQQVEVMIFTQTLPSDGANPDRGAYPVITAINAVVPTASGNVTVPVPLTSLTVGFGSGSSGIAFPPWFPDPAYHYGVPWNPYRAISPGQPAISGGGDDGFQDLYLSGSAVRTQGHIY